MMKMAESVEELAVIIKEQAKKTRKVSERVGDLESRIFGQIREGKANKKAVPNSSREQQPKAIKAQSLEGDNLRGSKSRTSRLEN